MRGSLNRKNQRNAKKYLLSETEYKTKFQLNWKTEQNICMSDAYEGSLKSWPICKIEALKKFGQ